MSFVSILVALLMEQARPLTRGSVVRGLLRAWIRWSGHSFDAGKRQYAVIAWSIAVLLPSVLVVSVYWILSLAIGWPAAACWNIIILYTTLGFRQFSHHFTGIRQALDSGDEELARRLLAHWQQVEVSGLGRSRLVRQVIEYSVIAAHRHVFGVLAWFSVLSALGLGPAGAVFYRLSEFVPRYWVHKGDALTQPVSMALADVAHRSWHYVDWLPSRITAMGFAVVGSFEEAIESWRASAQRGLNGNDGVILAATAGAINIRLGDGMSGAYAESSTVAIDRGMPGPASVGQEPEIEHLRTVVGLVWRTVLMWMILLALLTLARLLG
jgi:adenosylcobinamide-phosphate synthase